MLETLFEFGKEFVAEYGLAGLFLFSSTEAVIQPIPVEVVIGAEAVAGMNIHLVFIVALISNLLGASLAYYLGYKLGHPTAIKIFGKKKVDKTEKFLTKWEFWGVMIVGFTPLPYKLITWGAGIFELPFNRFLLASLIGRGARFALFTYGFQSLLGFLA